MVARWIFISTPPPRSTRAWWFRPSKPQDAPVPPASIAPAQDVRGQFLYYWSSLVRSVRRGLPDSLLSQFRRLFHQSWSRGSAGQRSRFIPFFGVPARFFMWAGCRQYARGTTIRPGDWRLFLLPAACGLVAPAFISNTDLLFPFHSAVVGGFGLLALLTSTSYRRCRSRPRLDSA